MVRCCLKVLCRLILVFFFFNDTATTEIYTLSLHDALPITTDSPMPVAVLDLFLELLRSVHGPNLLRLKGVVKVQETPDTPVVVHGVQHLLHPLAQLDRWPDDDHRTRLVFIMRDTEPAVIRQLFDAFLGTA